VGAKRKAEDGMTMPPPSPSLGPVNVNVNVFSNLKEQLHLAPNRVSLDDRHVRDRISTVSEQNRPQHKFLLPDPLLATNVPAL
jgi:hypothetical protein